MVHTEFTSLGGIYPISAVVKSGISIAVINIKNHFLRDTTCILHTLLCFGSKRIEAALASLSNFQTLQGVHATSMSSRAAPK